MTLAQASNFDAVCIFITMLRIHGSCVVGPLVGLGNAGVSMHTIVAGVFCALIDSYLAPAHSSLALCWGGWVRVGTEMPVLIPWLVMSVDSIMNRGYLGTILHTKLGNS